MVISPPLPTEASPRSQETCMDKTDFGQGWHRFFFQSVSKPPCHQVVFKSEEWRGILARVPAVTVVQESQRGFQRATAPQYLLFAWPSRWKASGLLWFIIYPFGCSRVTVEFASPANVLSNLNCVHSGVALLTKEIHLIQFAFLFFFSPSLLDPVSTTVWSKLCNLSSWLPCLRLFFFSFFFFSWWDLSSVFWARYVLASVSL